MAQENEIVIDVKVNTEDVANKLANATKALAEHKQQQKELKKAMEESNGTNAVAAKMYADVTKAIEEEKRAIKSQTAVLEASTQAQYDENASLDEQRQYLNTLQKAYAGMTKEQKDAAGGQEALLAKINAVSEKIKSQEGAMGDFRRSVGDYTNSILKAIPGMDKFAGGLAKVPGAAQAASGGIGGMTKAAMKFIATPVGAVIAAIVVAVKALQAIFGKLTDAIKKNDDASTGLSRLYATTIQPIMDAITAVFAKLADWIGKAAGKLADFFGQFGSGAKAADDYVKSLDNLQETERQYVENNAKRERDISELRAKATNSAKYSAKERRGFVEQAIALEKQGLAEQKKITAEKLRLLELEAKRTKDTSDAMKDKIAQARAEMYRAEQQYYDGTRKLEKQLSDFDKAEQDARAERARKAREKRQEQEKALAEQREKMAQRYMDELQIQLAALSKAMNAELSVVGLSEEEKQAIREYYNELGIKANQEYLDKLEKQEAEFRAKQEQERANDDEKRAAQENKRHQERIRLGLEAEKTAREKEMELLWQAYDQELISYEEFLKLKADLEEKYRQQQQDADLQSLKDDLEKAAGILQEWGNTLNSMVGASFDLMTAKESKQLQQYEADQKARKKALEDRLKAGAISQREYDNQIAAMDNALAEKQKEEELKQAKRNKALAIMEAVINTAVGIMKAVSENPMAGGLPGSAIAAAMGAIQIATIAAEPLPQFATGGIVGGSDYNDGIIARISSGEMILNKEQQSRLFDALSSGSNQSLGVDYEMMAAAMAATPAPVVVYKELQDFGGKVATYNEIASI